MDKAQKKHQKALRRQRKLAKRESNRQNEALFRVTIKPFEYGTRLKGFEETAFDSLSTAKIGRDLWAIHAVRSLYKEMWCASDRKSREAISKMTSLISYNMCIIGGAIPPFFVPTLYDIKRTGHERLDFVFQVFRPQKQQTEQGSIYHYFFSHTIDGKEYEVWFTAHALDRVEERLELTALDTGIWMRILSPRHPNRTWSDSADTSKNWGHAVGKDTYIYHKVFSRIDDETVIVPVFFPYTIKDNKILCMTCLLPGMGTPELPDEEKYKMVKVERAKEAIEITRDLVKFAGMPDLCQPSPEAQRIMSIEKVATIRYTRPATDQKLELSSSVPTDHV